MWLAVGRLEEAKDYPTLLRAFAQVRGKHPQARLWVVGQGSLQDQVKSLALELRLGKVCAFWGYARMFPSL